MGWSKKQFIDQAFEEIGMAPFVYDITASQYQSALRRLDSMIAAWNQNGIRLGYPLPGSPNASDMNADSGVPDAANLAIYLNLATLLAPGFGKMLPQETKAAADMAYNNLANYSVYPTPEMNMPKTMPRGQGTKPWRNFLNPYVIEPQQNVNAGPDSEITLE